VATFFDLINRVSHLQPPNLQRKGDFKDGEIDSISQKELLKYTCDFVWPGLACTFVDLRCFALTLVEIKFARKSTQVFHRLATQPRSTQVE